MLEVDMNGNTHDFEQRIISDLDVKSNILMNFI